MVEEILFQARLWRHMQVVARLQDVLATTIESLRRVSPLADADVTSVRDFHAGGLPTPNVDLLEGQFVHSRMWWAGIARHRSPPCRSSDRFGLESSSTRNQGSGPDSMIGNFNHG